MTGIVIFSNSPGFFSLSVLRYASAATRTRVYRTPLAHVYGSSSTSFCVIGNLVFFIVFANGTLGMNIDKSVVNGSNTRFKGRFDSLSKLNIGANVTNPFADVGYSIAVFVATYPPRLVPTINTGTSGRSSRTCPQNVAKSSTK